MIALAKLAIIDEATLLEVRGKLLRMARAMSFDDSDAICLAVHVSQLCRSHVLAGVPLSLTVSLGESAARPYLSLEFAGVGAPVAWPTDRPPFFEADSQRASREPGGLRCTKVLPARDGPFSRDCIESLRTDLRAPSRRALTRALHDTNRRLKKRLEQFEMIAYVTAHDLRGGVDQAHYDAEELAEFVTECPEPLARTYDLHELADNLQNATLQQLTILDGIQELLDLWNHAGYELEWFPATDLLQERCAATPLLADRLSEGSLRIESLGRIHANQGAFWAAVHPLLDNGFRYNDKPDRRVRVYRAGHCIHIEDNGNGIAAERIALIRQVFQKLDQEKAGRGMGITLCDALLDKLGWTLVITSQPGCGSVFTIDMEPRSTRHSDTRSLR